MGRHSLSVLGGGRRYDGINNRPKSVKGRGAGFSSYDEGRGRVKTWPNSARGVLSGGLTPRRPKMGLGITVGPGAAGGIRRNGGTVKASWARAGEAPACGLRGKKSAGWKILVAGSWDSGGGRRGRSFRPWVRRGRRFSAPAGYGNARPLRWLGTERAWCDFSGFEGFRRCGGGAESSGAVYIKVDGSRQ